MLHELLPHALRDPEVRTRFAEEYRLYRSVDADCLAAAPAELDHERAWHAWVDAVGRYLGLGNH